MQITSLTILGLLLIYYKYIYYTHILCFIAHLYILLLCMWCINIIIINVWGNIIIITGAMSMLVMIYNNNIVLSNILYIIKYVKYISIFHLYILCFIAHLYNYISYMWCIISISNSIGGIYHLYTGAMSMLNINISATGNVSITILFIFIYNNISITILVSNILGARGLGITILSILIINIILYNPYNNIKIYYLSLSLSLSNKIYIYMSILIFSIVSIILGSSITILSIILISHYIIIIIHNFSISYKKIYRILSSLISIIISGLAVLGFIFTYSPSEITSTSPATIVFIFNNKCYNIINISSSSYFILYLNYIKRIIYYLYVLHVMITSKLLVILIRIYYRLNNMYIYINNISITIYNNISKGIFTYSPSEITTNILSIRLGYRFINTNKMNKITPATNSTLIIRYIIYSISKLNIRYIIILICMKIRYRIIINSKMISHPVSNIWLHVDCYLILLIYPVFILMLRAEIVRPLNRYSTLLYYITTLIEAAWSLLLGLAAR